jgi:hypothetical protein
MTLLDLSPADFKRFLTVLVDRRLLGSQCCLSTGLVTNGMHRTGRSFKAIERQMGYHYAVVSRLVRKHTQTNNVKDLPRSGRPRVTSDRDDRALQRLVRRMPFVTAKRVRRCRSANSGRLMTLLDLSPADFKRFLTVLVDKRLLGSQCCLSTGLVANGIRLTAEGLETQKYSLYPKEQPAN